MTDHTIKHIKSMRLDGLPEDLRHSLKEARRARNWSQEAFGRQVDLPQAHISGIEAGKIVPRIDTLLDLVRALDFDLMLVPRALVPAVQALVRDHRRGEDGGDHDDDGEERSLYADVEDEADHGT
jgi:transcriptional regulator with XRE-family HTH domain